MAFNILDNGDIVLKQGDSDLLEFSFTDDNGNPIDITGTTLYFSVKQFIDDASYVFQKTITSHTDASNGQTEVTISSSDTGTSGLFLYDCVLVFANGERDSFLPESKSKTGKFTINKGVTSV